MTMIRCEVVSPLRHKGKRHEPGAIVEIDADEGADLVRRGVLSIAPALKVGDGEGKSGGESAPADGEGKSKQ